MITHVVWQLCLSCVPCPAIHWQLNKRVLYQKARCKHSTWRCNSHRHSGPIVLPRHTGRGTKITTEVIKLVPYGDWRSTSNCQQNVAQTDPNYQKQEISKRFSKVTTDVPSKFKVTWHKRARDLDLDLRSGHTAYRRASLIDLYLYTEFHGDGKKKIFESQHWRSVQVQSHVTQKPGQISKIRPDQI